MEVATISRPTWLTAVAVAILVLKEEIVSTVFVPVDLATPVAAGTDSVALAMALLLAPVQSLLRATASVSTRWHSGAKTRLYRVARRPGTVQLQAHV